MPIDVVGAEVLDGYRLHLRFRNEIEGEVDISKLVPFVGVFAELQDYATFAAVRVDRQLGTVVWPGGADIDPYVLYAAATGAPLPGQQLHHAE